MKRFTLAAATALMLAGPLAATASAQDYRGQRGDRGDVTDRGDRGDRGRDDNDWNRGDRDDRSERGDRGRDDNDWNRGDRRDDRRGDRNDRRHRWDNQRHNGYTHNGRWYYGPPPAAYGNVDYGYRNWRRGDRLPSYYQGRYRQVDYRREHLRAPPRGYRYVEDDRGDMLLVGIATGVILSVILSQ